MNIVDWLLGRFRRRPTVAAVGNRYRVGDMWCSSQVEVRQQLERLGASEAEIIQILRQLNAEKYGDPHR
ncbi:MAG TPA: hypothetical protein VD969_20180 [Symbiobacteriaceae bacterium]|nr:hypothetical protein [Symbiobacteriaceae bacterium]